MEEIVVEGPMCVGCGKKISRPVDADMALFRIGLNVHKRCLNIWAKIESAIKRKTR